MEKLPKGSSGIDHDHLDSALAEPFEVKGLNAAVGDDAVYSLQIADLAEAATAELCRPARSLSGRRSSSPR